MAEGKLGRVSASQTQRWMKLGAETAPERVGQKAREKKDEPFTNLLSQLRVPLLRRAYELLNAQAASGIDGVSWKAYGENLEANLQDLENRVHRGGYKPPPVRRVHIPKAGGKTRPLGLPTVEDKVLQQAVRMLMEPIYEESEFLGFSYGYRPGRSAHDALNALYVAIAERKVSWVLDGDIQSFFDTIDHGWLRSLLEERIRDGRLLRLIVRWLRAGVLEEGVWHATAEGTPQGGIISPLLANIYLHYVLDVWAHDWRRTVARGEVYLVRYADDFVLGFQYEDDARRFHEQLSERLGKHGLTLHPDKTRVIRFGRFAAKDAPKDGHRRPETFDFLGFTHYCGRSRSGKFKLKRRTSKKKRKEKWRAVREALRRRTHHPPREVHAWLCRVLRGYFQYYGVPDNTRTLEAFRRQVVWYWLKRLGRRSHKATWPKDRQQAFLARFALPRPRVVHPYPSSRLLFPST